MSENTQVAAQANKPSLLSTMANKRGMDVAAFERTVRATVMPSQHTNEQFAALMLVASKYDLDPITKEIYAFPAKGGGIVPIVSIDGWINLMNSHSAFDGFEIEFTDDDTGNPVSCTCRMYRKDRSRPVIVTEYLSECVRQTDPWKMKHRMLRHKTLIQTIRYAFGFSGVYDEDEGERFADMKDVTPAVAPKPPVPPKPPVQSTLSGTVISGPIIENEPQKTNERVDEQTGEITEDTGAAQSGEATSENDGASAEFDANEFLNTVETWMGNSANEDDVDAAWSNLDVEAALTHFPEELGIAQGLKRDRLDAIRKGK